MRGETAARAGRLAPETPASDCSILFAQPNGMSALWEPVGSRRKWAAHSPDPASHLEKISARDTGPRTKKTRHVLSHPLLSEATLGERKQNVGFELENTRAPHPQTHPKATVFCFCSQYLTLRLRAGECETQYLCFYFLRPYLWCVSFENIHHFWNWAKRHRDKRSQYFKETILKQSFCKHLF